MRWILNLHGDLLGTCAFQATMPPEYMMVIIYDETSCTSPLASRQRIVSRSVRYSGRCDRPPRADPAGGIETFRRAEKRQPLVRAKGSKIKPCLTARRLPTPSARPGCKKAPDRFRGL